MKRVLLSFALLASMDCGTLAAGYQLTPHNCSGTITLGGSAQVITVPTNAVQITVMNIDPTTGSGEPLWISFTGTASAAPGSYPLQAPTATSFANAGSYTAPTGFATPNNYSAVPNPPVSILGATTGHGFSCTYWTSP